MTIVNVRLEGPTEATVRAAAQQMGVQVSTVKPRGDCCHLYGAVALPDAPARPVTVTVVEARPVRRMLPRS